MVSIQKYLLIIIMSSFVLTATAQSEEVDEQAIYASLRAQLERACPVQWEGLAASMDTDSLTGEDIWQGTGEAGEVYDAVADKADFIALMDELVPDSGAIISTTEMADDVATVATECASHRVALLDALISKTPRDVLLALDAVNRGLNKSIEYLDGGWSVGDVRVTGRLTAQDGWLFLTGQTLGNASTTADLAGDEYSELFELAKNWVPNIGTEDWVAGQLVTLPDLRGRALIGLDNMGGEKADILETTIADKVGGILGSHKAALQSNQLPSHDHTLTSEPNHGHTLGVDSHKHKLRTSAYNGGNTVGYFNWMEGKGRTNYQNHITQSVLEDSHSHSLGNNGGHSHTVTNSGQEPNKMGRMQPSIAFNVEMKY